MLRVKNALLLEESKTTQLYIRQLIEPLNYELVTRLSLAEIQKTLNEALVIDVAIISLDITTKDLEEIVDLLIEKKIAVILLTNTQDYALKEI